MSERALERAYFITKRCNEERKVGLERTSSMDHALLSVLGRMERVGVYVDAPILQNL